MAAEISARIAGAALQQRLREDQILRRATMAIGVMHVGIGQHVDSPRRSTRARLDQNVLRLPTIGPPFMRKAPPMVPGIPLRKVNACDTLIEREAGDAHIGHRRAGADAVRRLLELISPKPLPRRMTTPGTPPSRTRRLEPTPIT